MLKIVTLNLLDSYYLSKLEEKLALVNKENVLETITELIVFTPKSDNNITYEEKIFKGKVILLGNIKFDIKELKLIVSNNFILIDNNVAGKTYTESAKIIFTVSITNKDNIKTVDKLLKSLPVINKTLCEEEINLSCSAYYNKEANYIIKFCNLINKIQPIIQQIENEVKQNVANEIFEKGFKKYASHIIKQIISENNFNWEKDGKIFTVPIVKALIKLPECNKLLKIIIDKNIIDKNIITNILSVIEDYSEQPKSAELNKIFCLNVKFSRISSKMQDTVEGNIHEQEETMLGGESDLMVT